MDEVLKIKAIVNKYLKKKMNKQEDSRTSK